MRILYDIVHPADVHFFRHAMTVQEARGDSVLVTSRDKDITIALLDRFGIRHRTLSKKGRGPVGLVAELLLRNWRLLAAARAFAPDILVGNNSPCVAHVGWLMGRPSLIFDDTEINRVSQSLYYPFVTQVHSPQCYARTPRSKQTLYPGIHALSYLHPAHFVPAAAVLRDHGLVPERRRVLLRFVAHAALHDVGARDLALSLKRRLVAALAERAEVVISSELPLPADLERFRIRIDVDAIHHLLAFSDLMVGESATMCAEAGVLGTPAIYIDNQSRGYADLLTGRYGLCFRFAPDDLDGVLRQAAAILGQQWPRESFRTARERLLAEQVDTAAYQIELIDRMVRQSLATGAARGSA